MNVNALFLLLRVPGNAHFNSYYIADVAIKLGLLVKREIFLQMPFQKNSHYLGTVKNLLRYHYPHTYLYVCGKNISPPRSISTESH